MSCEYYKRMYIGIRRSAADMKTIINNNKNVIEAFNTHTHTHTSFCDFDL